MQFSKEVIFLGYREMSLKDGAVLYTVSMFVDDGTLEVNVLASNVSLAGALRSLSFADKCLATFTLRKVDKLYRLSLLSLSDV